MSGPKYIWKVDKAGNRRYVRVTPEPVVQRLSETPPQRGEMAIEPPDEPVVAPVEIAPIATPVTKKAPAKRKPAAKKSNA